MYKKVEVNDTVNMHKPISLPGSPGMLFVAYQFSVWIVDDDKNTEENREN